MLDWFSLVDESDGCLALKNCVSGTIYKKTMFTKCFSSTFDTQAQFQSPTMVHTLFYDPTWGLQGTKYLLFAVQQIQHLPTQTHISCSVHNKPTTRGKRKQEEQNTELCGHKDISSASPWPWGEMSWITCRHRPANGHCSLLLISACNTVSSREGRSLRNASYHPSHADHVSSPEPDTVWADTYFLKTYRPTWMFWLEAHGLVDLLESIVNTENDPMDDNTTRKQVNKGERYSWFSAVFFLNQSGIDQIIPW